MNEETIKGGQLKAEGKKISFDITPKKVLTIRVKF
jgi:hypothetical protein